jgi:uncharacterized protein with von Willebrand factor type A (vWA) domain
MPPVPAAAYFYLMILFIPHQACWRALLFAALLAHGAAHAAEPTYSENLATLYNEYQRIVTLRDACIAAQPGKRGEFTEAYQHWFDRHVRIVDDLDNRFAAMVKRASKDRAEYSRNYGKYQAEVYQMREENKKALLADRDRLAKQCGEYAAYVRHPKSDIPALFPAQFKSVYRVR